MSPLEDALRESCIMPRTWDFVGIAHVYTASPSSGKKNLKSAHVYVDAATGVFAKKHTDSTGLKTIDELDPRDEFWKQSFELFVKNDALVRKIRENIAERSKSSAESAESAESVDTKTGPASADAEKAAESVGDEKPATEEEPATEDAEKKHAKKLLQTEPATEDAGKKHAKKLLQTEPATEDAGKKHAKKLLQILTKNLTTTPEKKSWAARVQKCA
jgi:hypothetical protein